MITEASKPAKYEASADKDAFIRELLGSGELSYARAADESDNDHDVYLFKAGNETLAAVTLIKRRGGPYGFWDPLKIDIRMPVYGDLRVITPAGALTHVNGIELFAEDILKDEVEREDLPLIPEDRAESITRKEYSLQGLYRKPSIEAWWLYDESLDSEPLDIVWTNDANGPMAIIIPPQPETADTTSETENGDMGGGSIAESFEGGESPEAAESSADA
jgi:hypothetical protein